MNRGKGRFISFDGNKLKLDLNHVGAVHALIINTKQIRVNNAKHEICIYSSARYCMERACCHRYPMENVQHCKYHEMSVSRLTSHIINEVEYHLLFRWCMHTRWYNISFVFTLSCAFVQLVLCLAERYTEKHNGNNNKMLCVCSPFCFSSSWL